MVSDAQQARRHFGLHSPTFGRDAVLDQLGELLDSGVLGVALQGAPGIGKTRVVHELAARRFARDASPVILSDWSAFTSFEAACGALGTALRSTSVADLVGAIRMQDDCLVLIDNVEQFQEELDHALPRWAAGAPAAQFVVSSRRRVNVEGMVVVNLPALPSDEANSAACELLAFHYARQGGVDDTDIQPLARLVGGVPLALGLVAGRAAVLGAASVMKALRSDQHLDEMTRTMDVSWSFLSEELRAFLSQLCCFHGGVTLAEIEAVVESSISADDALVQLIGESLVEVDRSGAENRYSLVVTVSSFCQHKGGAAFCTARTKHRTYYASRGHEFAVERNGSSPEDTISLGALRFNIYRAFDTACADGYFDDAMRCALALTRPRYIRQPAEACLATLDRALALAGGTASLRNLGRLVRARTETRRGMFDRAESDYRQLIAETSQSDPWIRGRAYSGLAATLIAQWKVHDASTAALEALPLHRAANDSLGEAWTLLSLSGVAAFGDEQELALEHLLRSVEIARHLGANAALVSFLMNIALLHLNRSEALPARRCLREALEIESTFGDELGHPWINYALGIVEVLDGNDTQGAALLARAVRATRAAGETRIRASALCGLAELARSQNRPESAQEYLEEALGLVQSVTPVALRIRSVRASLLAEQGRVSEGRVLMDGIRRAADQDWPLRDLSFLPLEEARVLLACAHFGEPDRSALEARAAELVAHATEMIAQWPESVSKLSLRQFHARRPLAHLSGTDEAKLILHTDSRTIDWNGESLDCRRRPVLWRLFFALCERPEGVQAAELIECVWQGEQMSPASARNRLHVAISSARKLTAPSLIELVDGVYRLSVVAGWASDKG